MGTHDSVQEQTWPDQIHLRHTGQSTLAQSSQCSLEFEEGSPVAAAVDHILHPRNNTANLLYKKQLSDNYTMMRLCWKSDTFLVYLLITIHSADKHSKTASIKLSIANMQVASYRNMDPVERVANACVLPVPTA